MCGRYSLVAPPPEWVETFDIPVPSFSVEPRRNVAPGQDALVVAEDRRGRRAGMLRWGFLPAWSGASGRVFINARAETVAQTPSFRSAFAGRRCLVPADGFYEWRKQGDRKLPIHFRRTDGAVFAMGGIWERWAAEGIEPHHGFAILTVDANADVAAVHPRMPLVIGPRDMDRWLDPATPVQQLRTLLRTTPAGSFEGRPTELG